MFVLLPLTFFFFVFVSVFFVERRGGCFFGKGVIVVLFFVMILLSSATIHACSRRRNRSGPQAHCHKEGCMESRCVSSTLSWAVPFGSYPIGITTIAKHFVVKRWNVFMEFNASRDPCRRRLRVDLSRLLLPPPRSCCSFLPLPLLSAHLLRCVAIGS